MTEKQEFWGGWRERVSALRNVPSVLRFVWESGRTVVVLGLLARVLAALLPPALFWVSKLIIDAIFHIIITHQPVGPRLWWLVAAEFSLAVLAGVLSRIIDYLDALLAGKYTHHVSVRVMEHAAGLDLLAYEDPVFYDRLERARVQATDRLYMIQAIGRLIQQIITTITLSVAIMVYSPWLAHADRGSDSCVCGRDALRVSGICQEFSSDSDPSSTRLPAHSGRQQRSRQGTEAIRAEKFLDCKIQGALHPGI